MTKALHFFHGDQANLVWYLNSESLFNLGHATRKTFTVRNNWRLGTEQNVVSENCKEVIFSLTKAKLLKDSKVWPLKEKLLNLDDNGRKKGILKSFDCLKRRCPFDNLLSKICLLIKKGNQYNYVVSIGDVMRQTTQGKNIGESR